MSTETDLDDRLTNLHDWLVGRSVMSPQGVEMLEAILQGIRKTVAVIRAESFAAGRLSAMEMRVGMMVSDRVGDGAWIVLRKREQDPLEMWSFALENEARVFFGDVAAQWSETFLCEVKRGGHQMLMSMSRSLSESAIRADEAAKERERCVAEIQALAGTSEFRVHVDVLDAICCALLPNKGPPDA